MEFTEEEIYFIKECVYIASHEGFYCLEKDFDEETVDRSVLKKLGLDDKTIENCMRGY